MSVKKEFPKIDLIALIYSDHGEDFYLELLENDISDTSRWSIHYDLVFKEKETKKYYLTYYSKGATESQDERPFEYDSDLIVCWEVVPVEKTVTVYEKIK